MDRPAHPGHRGDRCGVGVMTLAATKTLDVIYPCRPGDGNPELQASLRSLEAHFPHAQVWIVGHKPGWVRNVEYIPGNGQKSPRANLWHNLLTACKHPGVSDDVVIFNDDFVVTEPVGEIPVWYRGLLTDHIKLPRVQKGQPWWRESLQTTLVCLQALGHQDPLSYELHVPFRVNKNAMLETLERFSCVTPDNPPQWRTLAGNLHGMGGEKHVDCKAYRPGPVNTPYHSTDDSTYRMFATQYRKLFPNPCKYETR